MKLHVKSKQCIGENAQKYNEKIIENSALRKLK